jgi:hypothetical protein
MDVIALRALECPDVKARGASGDTRQHGHCLALWTRWTVKRDHDARSRSGGSVAELSVTGRCREGSVMELP